MITMEEIFEEIQSSGGVTPSRRLRDIASRFPERIAFRDKKFGIWNEISYKEFWLQANYVGCALNHFGIGKGDKVAIHSENRPEWLISDIGTQAIAAISVGLTPIIHLLKLNIYLGTLNLKFCLQKIKNR